MKEENLKKEIENLKDQIIELENLLDDILAILFSREKYRHILLMYFKEKYKKTMNRMIARASVKENQILKYMEKQKSGKISGSKVL